MDGKRSDDDGRPRREQQYNARYSIKHSKPLVWLQRFETEAGEGKHVAL